VHHLVLQLLLDVFALTNLLQQLVRAFFHALLELDIGLMQRHGGTPPGMLLAICSAAKLSNS
jgi:hypothetical protein